MLKKIIQGINTFFQIRISCPVCTDNGKLVPQSFWSHDLCGGGMFVGDNARILCISCEKQDHIKLWEFHCPSCSSQSQRVLEYTGRPIVGGVCISIAGQMVSSTGHRWLLEFMKNIGDNN